MGWGQKREPEVDSVEETTTTEYSSTWNTTHESNNYTVSTLIEHDEEVRIEAVRLTMEYFKDAVLRPEAFFRFAGFMEHFILSGEVPNASDGGEMA